MRLLAVVLALLLLNLAGAEPPAEDPRLAFWRNRVEAQQKELERLQRELAQLPEDTEVRVLMDRMAGQLRAFVAADLPFRRDGRLQRLVQWQASAADETLTTAERLQALFALYRDEIDLGQTLEAWDGELAGSVGEPARLVTFLRYGRLALVYQTFDASQTGWWNPATSSWVPIDGPLVREIGRGIQVALKRVPPDLLILPVAETSR
jgi:hypothetical protein